jgi:hypothetical protein
MEKAILFNNHLMSGLHMFHWHLAWFMLSDFWLSMRAFQTMKVVLYPQGQPYIPCFHLIILDFKENWNMEAD